MATKQIQDERAQLGTEWIPAKDAARLLGVTDAHLTEGLRPLLTHKSNSVTGAGARRVGYAYWRWDVERCAAIRLALGCTAIRAVQLLQGIRELGARGMLEEIEHQLRLELKAAKIRRTAPADVDRTTPKDGREHPLGRFLNERAHKILKRGRH